MEGESGEQVEDIRVILSGEWFMQGWRKETGNLFQRSGDPKRNDRSV